MVPFLLFGQSLSLKSLLHLANKNNQLIQAKEYNTLSKAKAIESANSDFWPTIDLGATISKITPTPSTGAGESASVYLNAKVQLCDGGRKKALKRAKIYQYQASKFEKEAFAKSVELKIVNSYYTVLKLQALLKALRGQAIDIKAQLARVKRFKSAGLATDDEVYKLQSVLEANRYNIENTKLNLKRAYENLRLQSGVRVKALKYSHFREPRHHLHFIPNEKSKILQANANAIAQNAKAVMAGYKPQVILQDTLSATHLDDIKPTPFSKNTSMNINQNRISLSVNMRLYDNGKLSKEHEVLQYKKMALNSQRAYAIKEQKMQFRLAKANIKAIRAKLRSAQKELHFAKKNFEKVKKMYENGIVDNISFLDAMNAKTLAIAKYKETKYDLELAKAMLYYYAGRDIKRVIR